MRWLTKKDTARSDKIAHENGVLQAKEIIRANHLLDCADRLETQRNTLSKALTDIIQVVPNTYTPYSVEARQIAERALARVTGQ